MAFPAALAAASARALAATSAAGALAVACAALPLAPASAAAQPSVVSINLCADQLVLGLADEQQILSVSWLAADPEESMLADRAARHPLNYGTAEELLRYEPDVVIGGAFTNDYTRRLLARLGHEVVAVEPAQSIADIERNIERVAAAVERPERGAEWIRSMRAHARALAAARPPAPAAALVLRPGGFTVGAGSLADELMQLAGLANLAADEGLDRWGSLSLETLLRTDPDLLIVTRYRSDEPSLANAVLGHPAVAHLEAQTRVLKVPGRYWACGLPQSLESAAAIQRFLGH